MKIWLNTLLLLVFTVVSAPAAMAASDNASCLTCHGAMQGTVEKEKGVLVNLNIDQAKFEKSVHGGFVACVDCHLAFGPNPHQAPSANIAKAVKDMANAISAKSRVDAVAQAACLNCHPDMYKEYASSIHGRNVIKKRSSDGPVCTSCHGSAHYIQPKTNRESMVNHFNVVSTCGTCHEEKHISEKYGFSPLVMERYLESFHGRKVKLGHPGAPVCSNCHGSHDVKGQKEAGSPVVGENKKKTCGTAACHPGATDKFVAAITHKPLHPIAHYSEIALILLTMGTFIFIITHVFLDIYADVRDRLFRKGNKHE